MVVIAEFHCKYMHACIRGTVNKFPNWVCKSNTIHDINIKIISGETTILLVLYDIILNKLELSGRSSQGWTPTNQTRYGSLWALFSRRLHLTSHLSIILHTTVPTQKLTVFQSIPQLLQHISDAVSSPSGKFPRTMMLDISSRRFALPFSVHVPNRISGLANLLSVEEKHKNP